MHYHSEGLECITHVNEAHIVENDDFCPICTLVVDEDFESQVSFESFITPQEMVIDVSIRLNAQPSSLIKLGRAPPSLS